MGRYSHLEHGERGSQGKGGAMSLKTSPYTPKTDSESHFFYILKFFNQTIKKWLKNGEKNLFFFRKWTKL